MKKINVAIVGIGNVGFLYDIESNTKRTHVQQIKNNKQLCLSGVCDTDKDKICLFKKNHSKKIIIFTSIVVIILVSLFAFL